MNNTYDLLKLLDKYKVVIPIIQRDYAQGRKDKQFIRKTFLGDIKNCLESNESMSLDFVYGNEEYGRFYPLDGQQRLTTLWLVYWYIAFKTKRLPEMKERLLNFSYETRESSKEFCEALCNMSTEEMPEKVVDYIKQQTWFYSAWLQDPTISAMLRTIGEGQENEADNIEEVFKDCNLEEYYKRLKDTDKPLIRFELMVIGNSKLPLSDDLYIKMNARGKVLTDFENFKSDLVSWINKNEEFEVISPDDKTRLKEYYPAQIDNAWTDVIWKYAQTNGGEVDDIFFSFINRYVLNLICIDEKYTPSSFGSGEEKINKDFNKLYGVGLNDTSGDDSLVSYEGFDTYKDYFNSSVVGNLDKLFSIISDEEISKKINKALSIKDADKEGSKYSFFPQIQEGRLKSTTQKERVYFLAITSFINNIQGNCIDEEKFNRWMRVVKNLIENAGIETIPTMITCMRLINNLAKALYDHKCDIYETLHYYSVGNPNNQLDYQLIEEKEKAEKILEGENWEQKIIEAENYSFFNGSIRFLFHDGECKTDWDQFDKKFEKAEELFKLEEDRVKLETVERFFKYFRNFDEIYNQYLFTTVGYHPRNKCWKKDILCNNELMYNVHLLLSEGPIPTYDDEYKDFLDSDLIKQIVNFDYNYKYRLKYFNNEPYIYKKGRTEEGVYVSNHRKTMCEKFKKLVEFQQISLFNPEYNFYCNGFYWGGSVMFRYNGNNYEWFNKNDNDGKVDGIYIYKNGAYLEEHLNWDCKEDLINIMNGFQDELINKDSNLNKMSDK